MSAKTSLYRKSNWSPQEEARAKALLLEGKSYSEVASVLGRSRKSVAHRNVDIWKIVQRQLPWTENEEQLAKELLSQGFSYKEVSQKLGRSITAIKKKNCRDWTVSNMKPREHKSGMTDGKAHANWYRFRGKRLRCLERDNFTCQSCGVQDFGDSILNVHHKDGNGRDSENLNNDLDNLVTLCVSCHTKAHFNNKEVANG